MKNKKIFKPSVSGRGKKFGIVVSQFNEFITKRLLAACLAELQRLGVDLKDITVVRVPGSLEIAVAALTLAKKKNIDAVIALGAIIRGETFHFELVAYGTVQGIVQASLLTGKPIIFGVLSTDTVKQVYKRSQPKGDNKGRDAAAAAVAMLKTFSQLK